MQGKREYQRQQMKLYRLAAPIRRELIAAYDLAAFGNSAGDVSGHRDWYSAWSLSIILYDLISASAFYSTRFSTLYKSLMSIVVHGATIIIEL